MGRLIIEGDDVELAAVRKRLRDTGGGDPEDATQKEGIMAEEKDKAMAEDIVKELWKLIKDKEYAEAQAKDMGEITQGFEMLKVENEQLKERQEIAQAEVQAKSGELQKLKADLLHLPAAQSFGELLEGWLDCPNCSSKLDIAAKEIGRKSGWWPPKPITLPEAGLRLRK